jgi:hypothetical protein
LKAERGGSFFLGSKYGAKPESVERFVEIVFAIFYNNQKVLQAYATSNPCIHLEISSFSTAELSIFNENAFLFLKTW